MVITASVIHLLITFSKGNNIQEYINLFEAIRRGLIYDNYITPLEEIFNNLPQLNDVVVHYASDEIYCPFSLDEMLMDEDIIFYKKFNFGTSVKFLIITKDGQEYSHFINFHKDINNLIRGKGLREETSIKLNPLIIYTLNNFPNGIPEDFTIQSLYTSGAMVMT